ncbi:hypothetical protein SAMN05216456_0985 [Devosia crocina]|uniref:DUF6969 domain-containing protein n=2 Tax=Devosia crocina TaxID=429728 RepID=A0A1I7N6X1_9HYPH|nr:hypothetical protein SAMN05216456_0985 [Devosia crocina]
MRCGCSLCCGRADACRAASSTRCSTLCCGGSGQGCAATTASGSVGCAGEDCTTPSARDTAFTAERKGSASTAAAHQVGRRGSAGPGGWWRLMSHGAREQALAEIAFCQSIWEKGGLTVLSDTFRGVDAITAWEHYPPGDVFDPSSNGQWFYHCHPAEEGAEEHGHFHCFMRPQGPCGPIHHLAAIGVDASGRMTRIFTVNQWVVGDDWASAEATVPLLGSFDMQMPTPSYLVNRWLTAIFVAYGCEIAELVRERDRLLQSFGRDMRGDRTIEVTSEMVFPARA